MLIYWKAAALETKNKMYIPCSQNVPGDWKPSSQNLPFQKEIIASLKGVQIRERWSKSVGGGVRIRCDTGPKPDKAGCQTQQNE